MLEAIVFVYATKFEIPELFNFSITDQEIWSKFKNKTLQISRFYFATFSAVM